MRSTPGFVLMSKTFHYWIIVLRLHYWADMEQVKNRLSVCSPSLCSCLLLTCSIPAQMIQHHLLRLKSSKIETGNANRWGRLNTVDLIKIACFVKKVSNLFNIKGR